MDRKRTVVGPMKDRVKSRISPINHRIWTVIAPMLFVAFGLFGVNEMAWGSEYTTKGTIGVGQGKGTVQIEIWTYKLVGSDTNDEQIEVSDGEDAVTVSGKANDSWRASQVLYRYFRYWAKSPAEGYTFEAWYTNKACTEGRTTNKKNADYYQTSTSNTGPEYEYYAKFVPNPYTIAFNANGGAGTMASVETEYDKNTVLTLNGFTKGRYTITFSNPDGDPVSDVIAYWGFAGWKKNNEGDTYDDGATVKNLATSGTATLWAQWSGTQEITLPTPTRTGNYSFAGWYNGDVNDPTKLIGGGGAKITPTSNLDLTAKWTTINIPTFTGASQEMKVGNTYSSFSFSNTSTKTPSASSSDMFYYVISNTNVTTSNTTNSPDGNKVIGVEYDGNTTIIRALNQGTADITFYQQADATKNIAEGHSVTYTFTVTKNDPEFSWTPQAYYFNNTYTDIFSSSNHDTQLTCSTTNDGAAEMVNGTNSYQKTLKTYNGASATITIEQAENYKWNYKKVDTYAITNNKANNHVAFTVVDDNKGTFEKSKTSNVAWNSAGYYKLGNGDWGISKPDDNIIIGFEGYPDILSFTLSCDPVEVAGTHYPHKNDYTFEVFESATNGNWVSKWTNDNSADYSASENVQIQLSPSTRYIKLRYKGTCWGRFTNIAVSELQYFRRQGENTTLNFGSSLLSHAENEPAVQSFVVEHVNAGYQTSVTAPEHYLVSKDNVNFASEVVYSTNETAVTGGDKMGTFTVYVKYLADAEGTHAGNVVVHNNLRADFNVPVTGTTQGKLSTTLHYIGTDAYNANITNIAATDLFEVHDPNGAKVEGAVITLTTGTSTSVKLATDNKSIAELCGNSNEGTTGNVVASYAGDGTHEAATNNGLSQNFTINRLKDEVSFDSGYESMVVGEEIDLTEWATSCTSGTDITVTSVFKDYIVIEDGKVKAVAKGNGRLRAASAGNCTYNSGVKFLNIAVRNPEDPCESSLLYSSKLIKVGAYEHNSSNPVTYVIPDGPQDKLTFKVWKVFAATQEATLQILDKNDNVLTNGTINYGVSSLSYTEPESSNVEIDMANYPGAKKLRFYGGGSLNKYFSEVRISQKAYLTASTSSVTMSTVQACDTAKGQFTVDYSDVSHIQLSQTNNDFSYEVWDGETKLIGFENGCKSYGTYTVKFFYVPQAKGPYSNTVTISASGKSQTITLNGTATKPDRTIVWDIPTGNTITATQSLDLTAYAETSCQSPAGSVYYTASPADAVTIDPIDGNHITFKKAASVTVTAHTVTSEDYNDAPTVDKVWTVGKIGTQMRTLPTITSTITYGDNSSVVTYDNNSWVAEDTLNHEVVTGIIVYNGPASFDAAGPQDLSFYFYPTVNAQTYDVCLFTVPVTVQKATTTASANAIVLTYGETPDSKDLSTASAELEGIWSWNDDHSDDILNASADAYVLNVTFTPNNTNYYPYETTVNVTVNKANPVVSVENVSFAYGTKADDVTLVGTGEGTWSWTDSRKDQVLTVGEYEMDVHFAPTDDANYNAIDTKITLTVTKANPVASVENVSFVYGTKADDVTLVGTGEGTWSWTDSRKDQVLTVGEYEMDVHFAPTDDANYNAIDKTITLTVTKANPAATVENVSFAYGTKAEDVALSGTGAGTWTWTDSRKGQTLTVGEYEMDVHFAPTDDANYNTIDTKITLTVTKANPVATASAVEITYGTLASNVTLSGTGLEGTWSWTDTRKDDVLAAGSYTMNVHFKPTDLANYNEKDATVALTVKKATTTLSWTSNPTDLAYNATDAVYTATSASDGAITYSIISGGSYAHIHANTGALTIDLPGNTITVQAAQAEGTNYSAPTTITVEVTIAAAPVGPNSFTGNGEWENPSNWSTGIVPTTAEPDIIVVGQLVINEEKTIGGLTIMPTGGVTIVDDGKLTVNGTTADQSGYGDLYVANGGEVEVAGSLTVRDLIVEASIGTSEGNAESGQVASAENIVYTNAYIDINMDPSGFMDDTKWYGFTVPFAVNGHNGVSRLEGTAFRQCVYGTDYLIAEYDANKRLNSGNGWKFISGSTLNAGQFYFLTVDGSYNTYRFKASGSSYTPAAAASLSINGDISNSHANWNGVGNSTLQHVTASYTGGEYVQVYKNGKDAYMTLHTSDANFVVGCPFFIQAQVATTLLLSEKNTLVNKYYAPRRMQAEATAVSRINLSATDGGYSDQIYFCAADKEQDAYIIGQDLAKAGVSTVVPQLWMAQYNQKLSVHEAAWNGDQATCPLGIYVPKNGEFVLTATQPEDGTQIYLTENGAPIWDLTMSEYVLSLEKGNTSSYGLMIVRAPQVTTGVDETEASDKAVRKVIIDNTMYIITPEGTMFNVIGKKVQ